MSCVVNCTFTYIIHILLSTNGGIQRILSKRETRIKTIITIKAPQVLMLMLCVIVGVRV